MEYRCWKCQAELNSTSAPYCSACGIVAPYEGQKRIEQLRQKAEAAEQDIENACLSLIVCFAMTLVTPLILLCLCRVVCFCFGDGCEYYFVIVSLFIFISVGITAPALYRVYESRRNARVVRACDKQIRALEQIHPDAKLSETLLRASDLPTDYLLHPAQATGSETAPEHLLRVVNDDLGT